jgi:hypothetical protein
VSWRNELVTRTEKDEDGEPVMVVMPRVSIIDADKISDEAAAAVAEVWQTVKGALRVKLHDKHAALVSIGKHLGMFVERVQIQDRKQHLQRGLVLAEPVARKPSGRDVLPILKDRRQARGERLQLPQLAMGAQMPPLAFRAQPR